MYKSVFTNYLRPYVESGLLPEVDQSKPSEIYAQLRIAYNQGSVGVLNTTRMVAPFANDEDDYDIIDAIWNSKELQRWLRWVNTNITLELGIKNYIRFGVCIRILTSWLNKIVESGEVSASIAARMHDHLCNNTWNENNLIVNEDLPF